MKHIICDDCLFKPKTKCSRIVYDWPKSVAIMKQHIRNNNVKLNQIYMRI